MSENACLAITGVLAFAGLVLMGFAFATLDTVLGALCATTFGVAILWVAAIVVFFRKNW